MYYLEIKFNFHLKMFYSKIEYEFMYFILLYIHVYWKYGSYIFETKESFRALDF